MLNRAEAARMFAERKVAVDGVDTTYRLYEPAESPSGPLPVILFLHGAGESGTDGIAPATVGIGPAIAADPSRFPALVVFPQASRGYGWREFNLAAAVAALDDVERTCNADRDRVSVTGISMGGFGTWLMALAQPGRFAAVVPVCGGLDSTAALRAGILHPAGREKAVDQAARLLAGVPQWAFHGTDDDVIPVEQSQVMVAAIRDAGAPIRYTEYPGVRHNSWDRAYAEPELIPWMLAQRRVLSPES